MGVVSKALARVVADGRVTSREWRTVLEPAARDLPRQASAEAEALLELWAGNAVALDPDVPGGLRDLLLARGYPVPEPGPSWDRWLGWLGVEAPSPAPRPSLVAPIRDANVSQLDRELEVLLEQTGRRDANVTVAVFDGDIDEGHPGLSEKLWTNRWEAAGRPGVDDDRNGHVDDLHGVDLARDGNTFHGTHVTGIATRGSARVDAILLSTNTPVRDAELLDYAARNGARVVNVSWAFRGPEAVRRFRSRVEQHPGVLFVLAAGNDGQRLGVGELSAEQFAAANQLPNLLVVAATDGRGNVAEYSNHGAPYATVAARGVEYSTIFDGEYEWLDGTSQAAPNASALLAKCLLLDDGLKPRELRQLLVITSDPSPSWKGKVEAGGPLNPHRALKLAALTGLLREGSSEEEAAARLELDGEERAHLVGFAHDLGLAPR
jgi:subtilisin family serine protease